ncbi:phosphoenolpyruvate carboxykinase (ATP)-like [Dioscorea cayenensis subsp. rotundata]|uniref:phosphoenolpyruvate carboxykinase (ATP) n=1 Tax=Dioscorea cayennensis subsp. rotundata TaxID=55577 RepID=A0AB40CU54_DIOCR|nr:phosphoenolpyruvate carboxykinase (ATP)-like [Dioscorea cayenensis subsp. rotundata]
MRTALKNQLSRAAAISTASSSFNLSGDRSILFSRFYGGSEPLAEKVEAVATPRDASGVSYGMGRALAVRGVVVKDKVYHNLKFTELQNLGASTVEHLCGLPFHVRGNAVGGAPEISKAQFKKILNHVTSHLSSMSSLFVQDGAVGSFSKCDAKVRVISDSSSAALSVANILWTTSSRAISHDSCPVTVYIASSIRSSVGDTLGLEASHGCAAVDIESSSLILCGRTFSDTNAVKKALGALTAPIISARGGIPLCGRLLVAGDSVILLFGLDDILERCSDLCEALLSSDAGVVWSSHGIAPFFQSGALARPSLLKKPACIIFATSDSTGALPLLSKLSPGQAAFHFLAGYQDGKFLPVYDKGPSPIDPLVLAKVLYSQLKDNGIPSFLINISHGGKHIPCGELIKLVKSTLSSGLSESKPGATSGSKVRDLKGKYKSFLSGKFQELPKEFSF